MSGKKKGMDLKVLKKVAGEMNDVMGLNPPIDTEQEAPALVEAIKANADGPDGVAATDNFSDVAWATFKELNVGPHSTAAEGEAAEAAEAGAAPAKPGKKKKAPKEKKEGGTRKPPVREGPTKKSIIIEHLERAGGATVDEMAQAITDSGIDPDNDKNKRTVKLWLPKIGFKVAKSEDGKYKKA